MVINHIDLLPVYYNKYVIIFKLQSISKPSNSSFHAIWGKTYVNVIWFAIIGLTVKSTHEMNGMKDMKKMCI